jgi:hypothetical protein
MSHYPTIAPRDPSPLQFPTMAEEALQIVATCGKTMSVAGLALYNGAHREYDREQSTGRRISCYIFADDSRIETVGRGKSYQAKALLP